MAFKVLVVWNDGDEEYLAQGARDAIFTSRHKAEEQAKFMRMGMSDECQSISVVRAEKPAGETLPTDGGKEVK
jgi:hypothetical protein